MHIHGNAGGNSQTANTLISRFNVEAHYRELIDTLASELAGKRPDGLRVRGCVQVRESTSERTLVSRGVELGIGMYQIVHDFMSIWICDATGSMVEVGRLSLERLIHERKELGDHFLRHFNAAVDSMAKRSAPELIKTHSAHLKNFEAQVVELKSQIAILTALAENAARVPDLA